MADFEELTDEEKVSSSQFSPLVFSIPSTSTVVIRLVWGRFCGKSALREAPGSGDRVAFDSSELLALQIVPVHKHTMRDFFLSVQMCACELDVSFSVAINLF